MTPRSQGRIAKNARRAAVTLAGSAMALTIGAASAGAAPMHCPHHSHGHSLGSAAAPRLFKGREISKIGQKTHDAPRLNARVVGFIPHNRVVDIFCKVPGDKVGKNVLWYKVKGYDGKIGFSWASAAFIANIGAIPTFCR